MQSNIRNKGIITYLLGAGASANSLPIVNKYSERFVEFIGFLKKHEIAIKNPKEIVEICIDFKWLIENIKSTKVDSLALDSYKNHKIEKLLKLKRLLAFFFNIEQQLYPVDQRYIQFIENIWPGNKSNLPSSRFRIINWNYDFQVEMAISDLADFSNISFKLNLQRQCLPSESYLYESFKKADMLEGFNTKEFSLIHLNGICNGVEYDRHKVKPSFAGAISDPFYFMTDRFDKNSKGSIEHQLLYYQKFKNESKSYFPAIKFAWEKIKNNKSPENIRGNVVKKTIEATEETEILIVIGYSFPEDNQEFDEKIIGAMKSLREIHIQDKNSEAIMNKFSKIFPKLKNLLYPIPNVEDFFVPEILN